MTVSRSMLLFRFVFVFVFEEIVIPRLTCSIVPKRNSDLVALVAASRYPIVQLQFASHTQTI